jgi:hypothetical protein
VVGDEIAELGEWRGRWLGGVGNCEAEVLDEGHIWPFALK